MDGLEVPAPPSPQPTAFTPRAWLVVTAFLLFVTTTRAAYALSGRSLPSQFEVLAWLGSGLLMAYLVRRDRALRGIRTPMDLDLLILVAWPIAVSYHFFATRGRQGWRPFLVFVAVYLGTYGCVTLLYTVARLILE